jgi:hypothetical protein
MAEESNGSAEKRRTWMPWLLVAGLVFLTAGTAVFSEATTTGVPTSPKPGTSNLPIPTVPFTGFGGYNWFGTTTSISAQWVVPTILSNAQDVAASTWIGAQSASSGAFIQLGVTEQRLTTASPTYEAFWSDTSHHYYAQPIQAVGANDTILASMTKTSQGWDLAISDATEQWGRSIDIGYDASTRFMQGEWLQEDPPPSLDTVHDEVYPVTTLVQFADVRVNGHVPSLPDEDAQALSGFGGIYLVPTAFSHDGFTLAPAQGAARQYLADAFQFDSVLNTIDYSVSSSRKRPSDAILRLVVAEAITGYRRFDSAVLSQSWPATVHSEIQQLVRFVERIIVDNQEAEDARFRLSTKLAHRFMRDSMQFEIDVNNIRTHLSLPPI